VGALAIFIGGLIVLAILVDFRPGAGRFVCAGVGVVLLGSGLLLIVRGPSAVLSKEGEAALASRLEKRAEREGLPTEPEAYQDGGLAVAASAGNVQDAEVLASLLKVQGIPAWVDGPLIASWGVWAYHSRSGVRGVVPLGRLEDAQAVLAEHQRDEPQVAEEAAEEQVDEETSEEEAHMVRQALGLAALALLLGPLAPWVLYRAFKLSSRIAGARRQWWTSPALRRANRWSLAAMFLASVGAAAWWLFLIPSMVSSCAR
jgi:hypothetical protein